MKSLICLYLTLCLIEPASYAIQPQNVAPSLKFDQPEAIQQYVESQAKEIGVDLTLATWIPSKESHWDPTRTGDDNLICHVGINDGKTQHSRGLWQISDCYHPEVSDKCAYDVPCSTQWSLAYLKNGGEMEWSTRKFCRKWYKDCPF